MTDRRPSPNPRTRAALALLLVVAAGYLLSLPWQRRQWDQARRLRGETVAQEARIRELTDARERSRQAEERARAAPDGDPTARLDAARALLERGDGDGAGRLLREAESAVLADPVRSRDVATASMLAGLFQQAGWVDRSLVNARRAAELAPGDVEPLIRLAVVEAQLGWQDECRRHVAQARRLAPASAEPQLALALLHEQSGALGDAERELRAADRVRRGDAAIRLLLLRNQMAQRRYDGALALIEVGLKTSPGDTTLLSARAEAILEQALARPGGDPAGLRAALEAIRAYQRVAPEDAQAHYLAGRALQALGDEPGTVREWQAAQSEGMTDPGLQVGLGRLLARRGDAETGKRLIARGEAARADATEFNRLVITAGTNVANPDGHRNLARWCQGRGKLSRAILEWEEVLRIRPGDAEAERELARCRGERDRGVVRRPNAAGG